MDKLAPWERMQAKTFTGWANSFLAREQLAITNIETDLGDGIKRTYPRIWYFFVFPKVSFRVKFHTIFVFFSVLMLSKSGWEMKRRVVFRSGASRRLLFWSVPSRFVVFSVFMLSRGV